MAITSLQNSRIKLAVRLRQRRDREREGLMLVEGGDELRLALAAGARPQTLFTAPGARDSGPDGLPALARAAGAELIEVTAPVFEKMSYRDNPDGWLAIVPIVRRALADLTLSAMPLVLVAEAVEKPGNLGAMLRTADAAGVDAVVVCDPATDIYNPNVVRASRGTLFTVPVVTAPSAEALIWLRSRAVQVVAATPQAALPYTRADLRRPSAIVVGTEDAGLTPAWLAQADVAVQIPMRGRVNSLNVAASAALLLYEAVRQRAGG
jgi:TrmH family RNA methyltransferase